MEITLDHEAGTVTFRAPELWNPHLGTIRIKEEDRGADGCCGGNAYLSPLASSVKWPSKFAALGKISTFRLVSDGRGPLATLLLQEDRVEGLLVQDNCIHPDD